jgi:hypothetical protein
MSDSLSPEDILNQLYNRVSLVITSMEGMRSDIRLFTQLTTQRRVRRREDSPERSVRRARTEPPRPTPGPYSASVSIPSSSALSVPSLLPARTYELEGIISFVLWSDRSDRLEMRVEVYWKNSTEQDNRLLLRNEFNNNATRQELTKFRGWAFKSHTAPHSPLYPLVHIKRPNPRAGIPLRILFTEASIRSLGCNFDDFPALRGLLLADSHPAWSLGVDWQLPPDAPTGPMRTLGQVPTPAAPSNAPLPSDSSVSLPVDASSSSSSADFPSIDPPLPQLPVAASSDVIVLDAPLTP